MKRVAILQSNYMPWKGYFDLIAFVDEFIIYDDVQYTTEDWRNRNQIKTAHGKHWLTIPVGPRQKQRICDIIFTSQRWRRDHWTTLTQNYRKAAGYQAATRLLEPIYQSHAIDRLSLSNRAIIETINAFLRIETKLSWSWDYETTGDRTERLVRLCQRANATEYVSGPAARNYLDIDQFARSGIPVRWFDYAGYPQYPQLYGKFDHNVSILDLLFNCGTSAGKYMRYTQR